MTETSTTTTPTCPRCGAPLEAAGNCPACLIRGAHASGAPSGSGGPGFEPPPVEEIDAALPDYDVQVLVGRGGMGAVYRARHRKLDRLVAIKVLRPKADDDPADAAAFAERFEREARVLAKLDHPHIVRIYDYGQTEGDEPLFYLVLEYVEGASLRELLNDGRLTAREALEFVPQICDALQTAHDLGVVHRDVKPENILVDGTGRVRIADFGLAKLREGELTGFGLTRTDQIFGTPHYMAPEQIRATGAVDHRADLYSLGVVLYEMLTGELPLGRFAAPSAKAADAKALDDVVFKALESEPEERYQEAAEIRRDVEGSAEGVASAAAPALPQPPPVPPPVEVRATSSPPPSDVSTAPGSSFAVKRTWISFGLLALTFPMEWAIVSIQGLLHEPVEFGRVVAQGVSMTGFTGTISIGLFEYPAWLLLVAFLAAAVLRTLRARGQSIPEAWPWSLTAWGLVSTMFALASVAISDVATVRGGLVLAVFVLLVNSLFDVAAYLERRSHSDHVSRMVRGQKRASSRTRRHRRRRRSKSSS